MKQYWIIILLSFFSSFADAQLVNLEWAFSQGGVTPGSGYIDIATSVAIDKSDNLYITGMYFGTADFDPGLSDLNYTSKGKQDIFIQKVDNDGNLIWAHSIGSTLHDEGNSVAVDKNNNVYVTGYFSGTVDFNPGIGINNLMSNGLMDVFVLKLDSLGNFIWAKSFGGNSFDRAGHIAVDDNGNVYALGIFAGTVDFDPGTGVQLIGSKGGNDYFIQKLDSNGVLTWVKTFGSSSDDFVASMIIDDLGNLYITGVYSGSIDFDPGISTNIHSTQGETDVFIQKINASGNFQWARTFGGPGEERAMSITQDDFGDLYVTGGFEDSVDFDPGTASSILYSAGYDDAFIEKIDANGNFVWVKTMGGYEHDYGLSIATDGGGHIYTTGYCQGTADYDPDTGTFNLVAQGNTFDTFIQKLDINGNFVWAKAQGGTGYDGASQIKINSFGEIILVGYFHVKVDFDPGFATYELSSNGSGDMFVQKLSECTPLTRTEHITACIEYTWKDSITYTMDNNTATHGIINANSCDSVITLDLTIVPVEKGVNVSGNVMIADAVGASYQWLDCSSGYQPIPGEITRSYIATQFGSYAVEVTENGCKDTSACVSINSVGFNDVSLMDEVSIFPNPTVGLVNIDFGSLTNVDLTIYSLDNRLIYQRKQINGGLIKLELNAAPGMYLVEIQSFDMSAYTRLLVSE